MCDSGGFGYVDNVPVGVRRAFDPDDTCLTGAHSICQCGRVRRVKKCGLDAAFFAKAVNPVHAFVIHDLRGNDVVACLQCLHQGNDGGHAGGKQQGCGAPFKAGQYGLGMFDGLAAAAPIDVGLPRVIVFVAGIGAGQIDHRADGAGTFIDYVQGLRSPGGGRQI